MRSRYQLSTPGERIQRQADETLATADAAREVSRELLALVARGLVDLDELSGRPGGIEPREALDRISTLFAQFGQFADSVRDFYAYLGQVIFRYDLDTAEFTGFKELLLDYAETIFSCPDSSKIATASPSSRCSHTKARTAAIAPIVSHFAASGRCCIFPGVASPAYSAIVQQFLRSRSLINAHSEGRDVMTIEG